MVHDKHQVSVFFLTIGLKTFRFNECFFQSSGCQGCNFWLKGVIVVDYPKHILVIILIFYNDVSFTGLDVSVDRDTPIAIGIVITNINLGFSVSVFTCISHMFVVGDLHASWSMSCIKCVPLIAIRATKALLSYA